MKKLFKIESLHNVALDSWEDGELENVNNYTMSAEIEAEDVIKAIELYFSDTLYYSFKMDNADVDSDDNQDKLYYNILVDVNNSEASKDEIEFWKLNSVTLYSNNITIFVSEIIPCKIPTNY